MPGRIVGRAIGFGVPLAAVAIMAAACGGSTPAASSANTTTAVAPATSSQPATTTTTTPAPTSAAGPAMTLTTESGGYGVWLADQAGRTLYVLASDNGTTSSCYGACAAAWPPLLTTGTVTGSGAAVTADLGTTKRTDGTTQVTYAGHPLYYFAKETGPNQVLGLGAQGVWFLVAPAGTMIKPVMAPPRMAPPPMTRPRMMPPPMTRPHMMPPPMTRPGMGGGMGGGM